MAGSCACILCEKDLTLKMLNHVSIEPDLVSNGMMFVSNAAQADVIITPAVSTLSISGIFKCTCIHTYA